MKPTLPQHAQIQDRLFDRMVASGNAVESSVQAVWADLLKVIEQGGAWMVLYHRVRTALAGLTPKVVGALAYDLTHVADQARFATAQHLSQSSNGRILHEAVITHRKGALIRRPEPARIQEIIFGSEWQQRMAALTSLASPDTIAPIIAAGIQQGRTLQQIAKDVRPALQGVQTSARRVARTEGMRVAHTVQMDAYEQLGDMVVGYQIHATLDQNTRPEHRRRDKTIYYKRPTKGQLGLEEMPKPPMEADGSIAFNCRCYLTPVLDPEAGRAPVVPVAEPVQPVAPAPTTTAVVPPQTELSPEPVKRPFRTGFSSDGSEIKFIPHEKQRDDEITIMVDLAAFGAEWFQSPNAVKPGGTGASMVKGRREDFQRFLQKGKKVQASRVSLAADGSLDVSDGRHRLSVYADMGLDQVALTVPKEDAREFRKRFGVTKK